ncbi:MAG: hypothetical protein Q4G59_09255, partial [Planctomycetia bacterium]|nr:hypothetical protein [Planctomycetia bacterium]
DKDKLPQAPEPTRPASVAESVTDVSTDEIVNMSPKTVPTETDNELLVDGLASFHETVHDSPFAFDHAYETDDDLLTSDLIPAVLFETEDKTTVINTVINEESQTQKSSFFWENPSSSLADIVSDQARDETVEDDDETDIAESYLSEFDDSNEEDSDDEFYDDEDISDDDEEDDEDESEEEDEDEESDSDEEAPDEPDFDDSDDESYNDEEDEENDNMYDDDDDSEDDSFGKYLD